MSYREIPAVPAEYEYSCDVGACPEMVRKSQEGGHFTESVPPRWTRITVHNHDIRHAELLLCPRHARDALTPKINGWLPPTCDIGEADTEG